MRGLRALTVMAALALPFAALAQAQTGAVARSWVAADKVPGMVVAIGKGEKTQFIAEGRIAAEANAPRANEDSLWRVYSMTKPITGIAAMILVDEGKLNLDQPISDFIPAFKNMKVLVDPAKGLESRPARSVITVRHLLTHTAGLAYVLPGQSGPLIEEYNRLGINPAAISVSLEARARPARAPSLEEFANRLATLPLLSDPGTKWSYSIGLDLLGRVIEVAGGMPFDQFVTTRIFQPLGMKSSYWTVPASEAGRLATNYGMLGNMRAAMDPGATSAWLSPPSFPYGGAGLVMSARDYDRFLHMLQNEGVLDGVRILKTETARLAMSDLLPAGVDKGMLERMSEGVPLGFGAGGSVYLADKPGGPGKGTYGWGGAAGTIGFVDRTRGVRATVMINLFGDTALRAEITPAIYADLK